MGIEVVIKCFLYENNYIIFDEARYSMPYCLFDMIYDLLSKINLPLANTFVLFLYVNSCNVIQ